tara:strand:+ start:83 stop:253 length:171 start_codon:yes stop_codon:yes gene_type:complete
MFSFVVDICANLTSEEKEKISLAFSSKNKTTDLVSFSDDDGSSSSSFFSSCDEYQE